MKTIHRITEEQRQRQPLFGKRILVCTHATTATIGFLHALVTLGGRVDFLPVSFSGNGEMLSSLGHAHGISLLQSEQAVNDVIPEADIIIEDGARITRRIDVMGDHVTLRPKCFAIEQTTNGIRYLEQGPSIDLRYPVVNVAESLLKLRLENGIATPESVISALLSVTKSALLARKVLIIGYGAVGSGIARLCRAHGSVVTIVERADTRRLLSQGDGFPTHAPREFHSLLGAHDVIISCTTNRESRMIGLPEIALMKHGTICCNAGSGTGEFAADVLQAGHHDAHHGSVTIDAVGGETLTLRFEKAGDVKEVSILAGGFPINLRIGSGTSTEAIDIVLSLMLLAAIRTNPDTLTRAIHPLDPNISADVARYYNPQERPIHVPMHLCAQDVQVDERPYGGVAKFGMPGQSLEHFSLARAVFRPGSVTEGHYHLVAEEAYYVESGTADLTLWHREHPVGQRVFHLRPGDYLTVPREYIHHVHVTSDNDFICLVIASPPFSFWDQFFPDGKVLGHDTKAETTTQERGSRP
jgi:adenosylhomocysteinase